jgi:hypothetical protein
MEHGVMLTKFYDDSKRPLSLHVGEAAVKLVRTERRVDFRGDNGKVTTVGRQESPRDGPCISSG